MIDGNSPASSPRFFPTDAEIVAKLPRTADGFPIVPGMKLYPLHPLDADDLDGEEDCAIAKMVAIDSSGDEVESEDLPKNYSSAEAATLAREKAKVP